MTARDFLVEIGAEEIPAKTLPQLSYHFAENVKKQLAKAELAHGAVETFATPQRIAVLIHDLVDRQKDRVLERKGPALSAAFDAQGKPTPACIGFANSCGISVDQLQQKKDDKGAWLFFSMQQPGAETKKLLPDIINQAVADLPIPRPMRWGAHNTKFIRPVHWVLMLYGKEPVDAIILGVATKPHTHGHHFHHPQTIVIEEPSQYRDKLKNIGKVIADFDERKAMIRQQLKDISANIGKVIIDEDLLTEVTGLVEWPVALLGNFEARFLDVPQETLISAMKTHQKSFPLVNPKQHLLSHFITISNIESKNPQQVIAGNERVMRARLTDAEFFYHADLKHSHSNRLEKLKGVVFQNKLGSVYNKAARVATLASYIAEKISVNARFAERAGLLSKCDLVSEMVGEFPELQGIMGYYYALHDREAEEIAIAIKEHYLPRFSGDIIPTTALGAAVGIADRLDTIVGIFSIGQAPTGEKDPFGLRRAAIGLLRIMIEKQMPLDLKDLLIQALKNYQLESDKVLQSAFDFIMERLRAWYTEQGIQPDVFAAAMALNPTSPLDFHYRVSAVQYFSTLPEAQSLTAANKRVSNILRKENITASAGNVKHEFLAQEEEKILANLVEKKSIEVKHFCQTAQYTDALSILASLQKPIDNFFDHVLVMSEDEKFKNNRLALLINLRNLFLQIADISLLQS